MLLFISAALLQASFLGFWFSLIDVANSLSAVNILTICGAVLAYRRRASSEDLEYSENFGRRNILKISGVAAARHRPIDANAAALEYRA